MALGSMPENCEIRTVPVEPQYSQSEPKAMDQFFF